ncbi:MULTISPECIES: extracellular solute-binding protein [Kocuria]|uniref:extracellular solute-binding protein n=1 Tax=Kocuria TaxID=57493 RepID=UPI001F624F53|nr:MULTISPECIES: extracellular solute-binding protein [Kocuria]MDT0119704.1 extracellular solute-binding protein [Kocuria sp. PD6]
MKSTHHSRRAGKPRTVRSVAAAAAASAMLLTGCSGGESGPPTLTWYINPDDGGQDVLAQQCSDASGGKYKIQTSLLPRDAASQREQLARRLAAGDTSMDIMSLDPPYVPELAEPGFLAKPPHDVVEATTKDTLEGPLEGAKWNGEIVAIPFWANTQLLWYRESVAKAAGLDMSEPVTWDQLIKAATSQDKYLGVQGVRGEAMSVWVNGLVESAGGQVVSDGQDGQDAKITLDSDAGKKAAEIIGTIGKEGLGGPGLATQDENASMIQFQGDKGSFMVNWPFIYSATKASVDEGTLDKSVLDDIKWTTWPRVDADTEAHPPLGGINLGVGAKSENQDLAWEAVQCIVSPEHQAQYFATNGNPPSSMKAFDDPEVKKAYPMADTIRKSLDAAKPRAQTPYYNEISTAIQQNWTPPAEVTEDTPRETTEFIQEVLKGDALL